MGALPLGLSILNTECAFNEHQQNYLLPHCEDMPKRSQQAELSAENLNELNGQEHVIEIVFNPDTAHFKCLLDLPKRVAIEVYGSSVTPTPTPQEMTTALNPE